MNHLSFSSDHVNYLILRYLQESRFLHSAFTFAHECRLSRDAFQPGEVPPGALVHIIQKGLQFIEMEANVAKDGSTGEGYTFFDSKQLMTKDIEELRQMVQAKRDDVRNGMRPSVMNNHVGPQSSEIGSPSGEAPMEEAEARLSERVTSLKGHTGEVFICSWSPAEDLLASGSGDASTRIWWMPEDDAPIQDPIILPHFEEAGASSKSKDVTSIEWSPDGSRIATGSYDGLGRVWSKTGQLITTFDGHQGPIFSIKWNSDGTALASGGVDKRAFVWDAATGAVRQQFEGAVLDVDWKDNRTFATCSTDHCIYVCHLGDRVTPHPFHGHTNEVNAIKWDPQGRLLASCSDDTTARIWCPAQGDLVMVLRGHTREIYSVKWHPGMGENGHLARCLATASFDATVKLWDLETGVCKHDMTGHSMSVYSVAFSPTGQYLASGSCDKTVLIWNVADGQLVKRFAAKGGIYEVCWNRDGTRVAACSTCKMVTVMDLRM